MADRQGYTHPASLVVTGGPEHSAFPLPVSAELSDQCFPCNNVTFIPRKHPYIYDGICCKHFYSLASPPLPPPHLKRIKGQKGSGMQAFLMNSKCACWGQ